MHRDILLAIPIRLVGVPPIPGLAALRPVEHTVGVAFVAPAGRSFLHIRAGRTGAFCARQRCAGDSAVLPWETESVIGSITIISRPAF